MMTDEVAGSARASCRSATAATPIVDGLTVDIAAGAVTAIVGPERLRQVDTAARAGPAAESRWRDR